MVAARAQQHLRVLALKKINPEIIALFHDILGPELKTSEGMFTHGWWLWPVGRYVEQHHTD